MRREWQLLICVSRYENTHSTIPRRCLNPKTFTILLYFDTNGFICWDLLCPQGDFLTLFEDVVAKSAAVESEGWEEQRQVRQPQAGTQAEAPDGRQPREVRQTTRGPVNSFAQAQREPARGDDYLPGAKVEADSKNVGAHPPAEAEVCVCLVDMCCVEFALFPQDSGVKNTHAERRVR